MILEKRVRTRRTLRNGVYEMSRGGAKLFQRTYFNIGAEKSFRWTAKEGGGEGVPGWWKKEKEEFRKSQAQGDSEGTAENGLPLERNSGKKGEKNGKTAR